MLGRTNTGGGGGGGGLNFQVIGGTTAPSNPKENTIWINTDQEITSWVFSATEPEAPIEGMVWITIGTSSTVEFNALKKNGIQVYPISAKQYVSGAWVDVTAKSYQGGEWVGWWNGELYDTGNEYTYITGGFVSFCPNIESQSTKGTAKINADHLFLSTNGSSVAIGPANKIDLTNYTKACINFTGSSSSNRRGLAISTEKKYSSRVTNVGASSTGTKSVDISSLTGEYYVWAYTWSISGYSETSKIDRIWLE